MSFTNMLPCYLEVVVGIVRLGGRGRGRSGSDGRRRTWCGRLRKGHRCHTGSEARIVTEVEGFLVALKTGKDLVLTSSKKVIRGV